MEADISHYLVHYWYLFRSYLVLFLVQGSHRVTALEVTQMALDESGKLIAVIGDEVRCYISTFIPYRGRTNHLSRD